jgi:hypothetical protein
MTVPAPTSQRPGRRLLDRCAQHDPEMARRMIALVLDEIDLRLLDRSGNPAVGGVSKTCL